MYSMLPWLLFIGVCVVMSLPILDKYNNHKSLFVVLSLLFMRDHGRNTHGRIESIYGYPIMEMECAPYVQLIGPKLDVFIN